MTEAKDFSREYIAKGAYHHHLSGFKSLWIERNYRLLADQVSGKVLDIACGDGRLVDFTGDSALVDGFDIVPEAITLAGKKTQYRDLWVGRIEDPQNYSRGTYDYLICSLSLQYLSMEDLQKHFLMIKGLLLKKGEYRFTYPNTKPAYAPGLMTGELKKIFSHVSAFPITGFIKEADALEGPALESAFQQSLRAPLEASYHYMITLRA